MKVNLFSLLTLGFLFLFPLSYSRAQSVVGFWEIKKVKVGTEVMTPVAKWTRINEGGTFESGNGWLQNAEGTWTYDEKKKTFFPKETNGITDTYGAFQVSWSHGNMIWEREEEGAVVSVTFRRITELPKSTADKITGLWDLTEVFRDGEDITAAFDPGDKHYLFLKWDRLYLERTTTGERSTGYWHIDGHRPEITLIGHRKGEPAQGWKVSVIGDELSITGISDNTKGMEIVYRRISEFPE